MQAQYIVVGSGLTGCVIARKLADCGKQVLIVERRSSIGGNVADHRHPSGILVHSYGPHYFRTSCDSVWSFVNRFTGFYKFEAVLKTLVGGRCEHWPVTRGYLESKVGPDWRPPPFQEACNFEEASLLTMPRFIYEQFVKGYTEKQWGVPAAALRPELASRFRCAEDDDFRLKTERYQGLPDCGYSQLMQKMVSGIPVMLNCDYLCCRDSFPAVKKTFFTGPIDEYFGFALGRLAYRAQRREHIYLPDIDRFQDVVQVNNPAPENGAHVRTIEWKHAMPPQFARQIQGTVITHETPFSACSPDEYEYPFPDEHNQRLYDDYRCMAQNQQGVVFCGRLGEYRYYDMDQAIARGLQIAEQTLAEDAIAQSVREVRSAERAVARLNDAERPETGAGQAAGGSRIPQSVRMLPS